MKTCQWRAATNIPCDSDGLFRFYFPLKIRYIYCITGCDHVVDTNSVNPLIYSINVTFDGSEIFISAIRALATYPETVLYGRFSFICE